MYSVMNIKGAGWNLSVFLCNVENASNEEAEEIKRFAKGYFANRKSNIVGERGNA